jgi:c-di-GMP-binding flagellar brake protein YcgR
LPDVGEVISIEQFRPIPGEEPLRVDAVVRKIGFRSLVAESVGAHGSNDSRYHLLDQPGAVVASFVRQENFYSFESSITGYDGAGGAASMILRRPKRVVKVQRRSSYRVFIEMMTTFRLASESPRGRDVRRPAKIINISEGGLLISCSEILLPGVEIVITIPSGREASMIDLKAEILEVSDFKPQRPRHFIARLRFSEFGSDRVTQEHREEIARYVFEQQRLMLQTRRLLYPAKKSA